MSSGQDTLTKEFIFIFICLFTFCKNLYPALNVRMENNVIKISLFIIYIIYSSKMRIPKLVEKSQQATTS